jgi:hypothetical protein
MSGVSATSPRRKAASASMRPDLRSPPCLTPTDRARRAHPKSFGRLATPGHRESSIPVSCSNIRAHGVYMFEPQWGLEQRIVLQTDLPDRVVIRCATIGVHFRASGSQRLIAAQGTRTAAPSNRPARRSARAWLAWLSGYRVVVVTMPISGTRRKKSSPSFLVRLATDTSCRSSQSSR